MAEALGWRWEFGVQVPPLLLCMAMSMVVIPDDIGLQGPRRGVFEAMRQFDFGGSALLTVSTTTAILGLVRHSFVFLFYYSVKTKEKIMKLTSPFYSL
jgi:predicted MFS family arabinose efflux permease